MTAISPFDPLADLAPDEPRFVIRGRDPIAQRVIAFWAHETRNRAISRFASSSDERDAAKLAGKLRQCAEAEEVGFAMDEWAKGQTAAEGERANYQQVERTEAQIAELDRQKRIEAYRRHLREASYHLSEAIEGLAREEITPNGLREALNRTNHFADALGSKA
jgi:hypothetical protein